MLKSRANTEPDLSGQGGRVPIYLVTFVCLVIIVFSVLVVGLPYLHLFVSLLAVVVFIIAFAKTDIALVIILLSMLLSPELQTGKVASRAVNIRAEDLLIFVVFLGWTAKMAVRKELGFVRRNPLNGPIMFYVLVCLVSSLIGVMEGRVKIGESALYLLKYFEYYLIFFMVGNNLRTTGQVRMFFKVIMLVCLVVCAISWVQLPLGQRLTAPFESEGGEPNTYAGYLLLMMSMMLGSFIYSRTQKEKLIWFSFFVFAFVPFVFTLSREGWISFIPMILAYIIFSRRARYPLIAFAIMAALLLPYLTPKAVHERAQSTFYKEKQLNLGGKQVYVSESAAERIVAWEKALYKLSLRPLFGAGVPGGKVIDNQYTRVLIETGLVGFGAFIWLLIMLFRMAARVYRQAEDEFSKALSIGFICAFGALLVQSFGGAVFILIRIMEPFWFIAAMVLALPEIVEEEKALTGEAGIAAV